MISSTPTVRTSEQVSAIHQPDHSERLLVALRIALLMFDGCDLLDVGGPYEVLLTANRLAARRGEPVPFEVVTVAPDDQVVVAYGGLGLQAQATLTEVGRPDVVVIPGLIDVEAGTGDTNLLQVVGELVARGRVAASVCTGAFLLAAVGALDGRPATTHHEDVHALVRRDDVGEVRTDVRWVDDGDVVTGAGLASGLALGLHLVDRFAGRDLAAATARQIEHPWDPDGRHLVA